jgi:biotin operon repressor
MKEPRSLEKAKADGGFGWIAHSFVDDVMPDLSGLAVKIYLYFTRKIHNIRDKEQITRDSISLSEIASKLKRSKASISKALKELEKAGVIEKIGNNGFSYRFKLLDTSKGKLTGGVKETIGGSKENSTPPDKKSLLVNFPNDCETTTGEASKSIRDIKSIKSFREKEGSEIVEQSGPRRV